MVKLAEGKGLGSNLLLVTVRQCRETMRTPAKLTACIGSVGLWHSISRIAQGRFFITISSQIL